MELEYCFNCGCPTGKAGKGDGSLYLGFLGPFCDECYEDTGVPQLEAELEEAKHRLPDVIRERLDQQNQQIVNLRKDLEVTDRVVNQRGEWIIKLRKQLQQEQEERDALADKYGFLVKAMAEMDNERNYYATYALFADGMRNDIQEDIEATRKETKDG